MSKLTNDLNAVRNLVGPGIMYSACTVTLGVAAISVMLNLDWWLTLLALAPMPLVSIAVKVFGGKIHDRFEKIQELYSRPDRKSAREPLRRARRARLRAGRGGASGVCPLNRRVRGQEPGG